MRPLEHGNGLIIESYVEIGVVSKAIGEACLAEVDRAFADDLNASLMVAAGSMALQSSCDFDRALKISDKPLMILLEDSDAALVTEALSQFASPDGEDFEHWLAEDMVESLNKRGWHS